MLSFRNIDADAPGDLECLVRWGNDSSIRHLFQSFASEEQSQERLGLDVPLMQRLLRKALTRGKRVQLVEWESEVVGQVTLEMDPLIVVGAEPGTAWLGIVIGEKKARGQGLGRVAMLHLQDYAKTLGAKRAQIGVFEFNTRALGLYLSLGYIERTRIPNTTWWKGQRWQGIRLDKQL